MENSNENTWHIVRHAKVNHPQGRIYGALDVDIIKNNQQDVHKYQYLAKAIPNCDKIVLSGLKRTRQTLEQLIKYNSNISKNDIIFDSNLNERCFGVMEDKLFQDLNIAEKAGINSIWLNPLLRKPHKAESFFDLLNRVIESFIKIDKQISSQKNGKKSDVLAVLHFGSIISLLVHALKIDPLQSLKISVANLSLTKLVTDGHGQIIKTESITAGYK